MSATSTAPDTERARSALFAIDPGCPRADWHRIGRAAIAAGLSVEDLIAWSEPAPNFVGEADVRAAFRTIKPTGGTTENTLFAAALAQGWKDPTTKDSPRKAHTLAQRQPKPRLQAPPQRPRQAAGMSPADLWERFEPATEGHPYITAKAAQGVPLLDLRVVPQGDPLRILGEPMAGALVVPCRRADGALATLQFVTVGTAAERLKAAGRTTKPNLPGQSLEGWHTVGEVQAGGEVFICEGIGTAWACWRATGRAAVVAFGWGRVRAVAQALRERDTAAQLVLCPDVGKEGEAAEIAREVGARVAALPDGWPQNSDCGDFAQTQGADALEALLAAAQPPQAEPQPFEVVPIADLDHTEPPPPAFAWDGLVPQSVVTLLGAHGGTGKSTVGLMLCVAAALGLPLFGIATRQAHAAFFSGEDAGELLRYRLRLVCRGMGVDMRHLEGRLHILDATAHDPRLYVDPGNRRDAEATPTFASLRNFMQRERIGLLVVDNASDAFDASEIDRARVRAFMRHLGQLARDNSAGVVLLAHVDKGTSRGDRTGSEGYSGSTAWHNSARSRLFMARAKDGSLTLEHQKSNLGPLREPLRLVWPHGGIPTLDAALSPVVQGISDRVNTKALLRLIAEFSDRGEWVGTATTSRNHAARLLCREPGYPRLKDGEVFDLLRRAEREGLLARVTYRNASRHEAERWDLTPKGREAAELEGGTT